MALLERSVAEQRYQAVVQVLRHNIDAGTNVDMLVVRAAPPTRARRLPGPGDAMRR
jgi:hypothetical protein